MTIFIAVPGYGQDQPDAKAVPQPAQPAQSVPAAPADTKAAPPADTPPAQPSQATEGEPPVPQGPANAAIQKREEELREKAAKEKQEEEKPTKNVPRIEYIKRPGAPRERLPNYIRSEPLRAEPPSPVEEQSFAEMRRGQQAPNPQLIDKLAKWYVYRLTAPGDEANISRKVEEIFKEIRDAKTGQNEPNTRFRTLFKKSVIKYSKDLLNNSLVVRLNALILLAGLFDGESDVTDAIPIFMDILKNPELEDAMHFRALIGIDAAKQRRLIEVRFENEIVRDIMSLLSRENVQPILTEKLTETLGNIGHAFSGNIPERADIATYLANVAIDSDKPLRLRFVASMGLANMQIRDVQGWNHELQGLVLCVFLKDLISKYIQGDPEVNNQEVYRWWVWRTSDALRQIASRDINRTNPKFSSLGSILANILTIVIDRSRTIEESELKPLVDWINEQQGLDKKLAPRATELEVFGSDPQAKPTTNNLK